jgi:hypothetical protein
MILLVLIALFFYLQLKEIDWSQKQFKLERPFYLLIVLVLVPLNWMLEWWKWTSTMNVLEIRTTTIIKKYSFFAGIVTGMGTPNMLGNFIGRIYYFERRHRVSLTILTLMTNYAQFIASFVFGIIGILILGKIPFDFTISKLTVILGLSVFVVILLYFNFERIFRLFNVKPRIYTLIQNLKKRKQYRWKILFYSLLRHSVFTLQFLCMLHAFGEDFTVQNIFWIWQVYLWVTLAPSLILGKLAIRESISIWVLTLAGMGEVTVLISSFMIWILNLLVPTMIGILICKRKN